MNIIMMGAQGTGKGTVAGFLKEELNLPHISTGEIFRKNIKELVETKRKYNRAKVNRYYQKIIDEELEL